MPPSLAPVNCDHAAARNPPGQDALSASTALAIDDCATLWPQCRDSVSIFEINRQQWSGIRKCQTA